MANKDNKLTEDELKLLKKEIANELAINRHALLTKFPFTGSIAMRFDLIPVRDKRLPTACTDGRNIYADIAFWSELSKPEREFVLAHEIWHCVMLHLSRLQTRDQKLFNIATDMEVNALLKDSAAGMNPPSGLLFPPDNMKGKNAEEIYDWLLKKTPQQIQEAIESGNASSSSRPSGNGNDKSNDKLKGQFDKHTYGEDEKDETDDENDVSDGKSSRKKTKTGRSDKWGEVGYDSDYKPNVPQDIAERMREAVVSSAQMYERQHGNLPAGVAGIVGKLAKPEVNWREELCNFVTSIPTGCFRFIPPNRRHIHNDMYFQSRRSEAIRGIVCLDTSGSCMGDLPKFFGELKGLMDSYGNYELTVIQCDAAVDKVDHYDQNNPFEVSAADDIEWSGGGGTSFVPPFEYIEENQIDGDFIVYLTDGYGDAPKEPPKGRHMLWLITKDGTTDFCDWGKKIRLKESQF